MQNVQRFNHILGLQQNSPHKHSDILKVTNL